MLPTQLELLPLLHQAKFWSVDYPQDIRKLVVSQDVEFKTLDCTTLRGRLFPAKYRGPGVVMSTGVSFTGNICYQSVELIEFAFFV